jgi:hypothetical protein
MRQVEEQRGLGSFAALFGLQDETTALVEIDKASAGKTRGVTKRYGALEDVVILAIVRHGGVWPRDLQVVAQLGEEECVVRPFRCGRVLPPFNEWIRRHGKFAVFLLNESLTGRSAFRQPWLAA